MVRKLKANHLAYIEPRWYGSRISADCQQNLISLKHDTSERFLPVTFLKERKGKDDTQRRQRLATCLLENGRDHVEIKSSFCEKRVN